MTECTCYNKDQPANPLWSEDFNCPIHGEVTQFAQKLAVGETPAYDINKRTPEWLADAFKRKEEGNENGQLHDNRFTDIFVADRVVADDTAVKAPETDLTKLPDPDIEVSVNAEGKTVHTTKVDLRPLLNSMGLLPADYPELVRQLREGGTDLCKQAADAIELLSSAKTVDDQWHDSQVKGLSEEIERLTEKADRWLTKCVEAEEKVEVLTVQRDRNEAGWRNQTDVNTRLRVAVASAKLTLIKALM